MFREMRRFKQQLSEEECRHILKTEKRGVLAVNGDGGYPYTIPINYIYEEESGKIYFHGAKEGHKIDALLRDPKASFCVYDHGYRQLGDWAYTVKSVVVFGRLRMLEDREEMIELSRRLGRKYYPTEEELESEIAHSGKRVQILELAMEHMTGKLVHEK